MGEIYTWFWILCLCWPCMVLPQNNEKIDNLEKRILSNQDLMGIDPEKAFLEIKSLKQEAVESENKEGELILMGNECRYFEQKLDIEKLIIHAEKLKVKAKEYDSHRFQAVAHRYLMNAYTYNELYDKAEEEFDKIIKSLRKLDQDAPKTILGIGNAYMSYSNMYLLQGDAQTAVKHLLSAYKEFKRLEDKDNREKALYWVYSNLASAYLNYDIDSAEYFVHSSMLLAPKDNPNNKFAYKNHSVLGEVYRHRKEYDKAVEHYHISEDIGDSIGMLMNKAPMYKKMVEMYRELGDTANESIYTQKQKDAKLQTAENVNKSMHKILEETTNEKNRTTLYYILLIGFLLIAGIVAVFYFYRKRKKEQARDNTENFNQLVEAARNNDPAFMYAFEKQYPGFSEKLLKRNPDLTQYEVEFCALLRMNLSSKDIAKVKFLELKTVQNRKSRLRKRLNIPENQDTYKWFSEL